MSTGISTYLKNSTLVAAAIMVGIVAAVTSAQDRLPQYPGYAQFQKMSGEIRGAVKMGSVSVTWKDGGQSFDYQWDGKSYHYDIASRKATEDTSATAQNPPQGGRGAGMGGRGGTGGGRGGAGSFARAGQQMGGGGIVRQQTTSAPSPDGKYSAFSRDGNLYLSGADGSNESAITTDGNAKARIRYGIATIIYGEELGMAGGIFWSPDSRKLAY